MTAVTIYRSYRRIFAGEFLLAEWPETAFAPLGPPKRESRPWSVPSRVTGRMVKGEYTHEFAAGEPVVVELPPLARFDGSRVYPSGDRIGVDAASALYLAERGERGFTVKQPSLFGDDEPTPASGAYPVVRRPHAGQAKLEQVCGELKAHQVATQPSPAQAPAGPEPSLVTAVRRAIQQLDRGHPMSARSILQCALEDIGVS
jgi:hypothetical protein